MNEKYKTDMKKYLPDFIFLISIVIFHVFGYEFFGDDVGVKEQLADTLMDELRVLNHVCDNWSSRIIINPVIYIVTHFDYRVWMVINISAWMTIFETALYLCFGKNVENKTRWIFLVSMLMFPFEITVSVGWITCSITYVWTAAAALISLVSVRKYIENERLKWYQVFSVFVCGVFAANEEELSVTLTIIFGTAWIAGLIYKKSNPTFFMQFFISVYNVFLHLLSKGNQVRQGLELAGNENKNMYQQNIFGKIGVGLMTTLNRLFIQSDYVVLIMLVVMLVTFIVARKYMPACILIVPLLLCISGTFVELSNNQLLSVITLLETVSLICILVSVFWLREVNMNAVILCTSLIAVGSGRAVVGFANNATGPYDRTYTYLYLFIVAMLSVLLNKLYRLLQDKKNEAFVLMMFVAGIFAWVRTFFALGII